MYQICTKSIKYVEDVSWPLGDKKFLFPCCKIFHLFAAVKRVSAKPRGHVMFYEFYYINTNKIPIHFTLIGFFAAKAIYFVTVNFLCVTTSIFFGSGSNFRAITRAETLATLASFRAKAHLV